MRQWIVVMALVACGGGKGGIATSARAAVERNAQASCGKAFDCRSSFPTDAGFTFEELFGASEPECVANLTQNFEPDAIQASVDAGRIVFDPIDADICLDAFLALTCDELWSGFTGEPAVPSPPECETSFVGTVAEGGTCTIEQDCAGENACVSSTCMP